MTANGWLQFALYAIAMLLFSVVSLLLTYAIERAQYFLPWNPQHLAGVPPAVAFNTAASFTTNTNWQSYTPESTISYFTEMVGFAYHNFLSAAIGIASGIALVRGIARKQSATIDNFWVDVTRIALWILLPLCLIVAPILTAQGVPQNLKRYTVAAPLENPAQAQTIGQGPVASQEVIKELGNSLADARGSAGTYAILLSLAPLRAGCLCLSEKDTSLFFDERGSPSLLRLSVH